MKVCRTILLFEAIVASAALLTACQLGLTTPTSVIETTATSVLPVPTSVDTTWTLIAEELPATSTAPRPNITSTARPTNTQSPLFLTVIPTWFPTETNTPVLIQTAVSTPSLTATSRFISYPLALLTPIGLYTIYPNELIPQFLMANVERFSWSPDGLQIAFEADSKIFVITLGGNIRQLTPESMFATDPIWSPDGTYIAFNCTIEKEAKICVIRHDGTSLQQLADNGSTNFVEGWSPDSSMLLFVSDHKRFSSSPTNGMGQFFDSDIWIINTDGSNPRRLTDGQSKNWSPVWSPDGRYIAFVSDREGYDNIYVMSIDGTNVLRVSSGPGRKWFPQWATDSSKLMYVNPDSDSIVFVTASGKELTRWEYALYAYEFMLRTPPCVWSPDSLQIACRTEAGVDILDNQGNVTASIGISRVFFFQWAPIVLSGR